MTSFQTLVFKIVIVMASVTAGMTSNCRPTYSNTKCGVFPAAKYQCSPYLGNQFVYNYTKIDLHDNEIKSTFNLVKVILGDTACANLLFSLMCIRMYPPCLNWTQPNSGNNPQQICAETCLYLHKDVCRQNLNEFGEMVMQFESVTLDANIKTYMGDLLKFRCNESSIFPTKDSNPIPECYTADNLLHVQKSETCHNNGFHYSGSLNITVNKTRCKPWSVMCRDNHLFDYSVIENTNDNYCRNPSSYREAPWCYVDDAGEKWEYCDITKCPAVNGNYGEWTAWSNCTGACGSYLHKTRTRKCDSPAPKFGGKNCSRLGINIERQNCGFFKCSPAKKTLIYIIVGSMAGVIVLLIATVFVLKFRKSPILEYAEIYITADAIHDMTSSDQAQDQNKLLAEDVYEHLKSYSLCFCMNCIKNWLISIINTANDIDHTTKSEIIKKSLERLETYRNKASKENTVVPPDVVPANDGGGKLQCRCSDSKSSAAYTERVLREWLNDTVHYSKLSDVPSGVSRPLIGMLEIEGYRIMPVYDKLSHIRKYIRKTSESELSETNV